MREREKEREKEKERERETRFKKRQAHHFITTGLKKGTTQV